MWIQQMKRSVKPWGYIGLVLSTAQIQPAIETLSNDYGGITLLPLLGSEAKKTASRCLLFARQGSRSPFQIATPFVVRNARGEPTQEAQSVLMDMASLPLPLLK